MTSPTTHAAFLSELQKIARERGLWDNIHAKRRRIAAGSGERMRRPESPGAPTAKAIRDSQKTAESSSDVKERRRYAAMAGVLGALAGAGISPSSRTLGAAVGALHAAPIGFILGAAVQGARRGAQERSTKTASVEYRGVTFPGYNKPIPSNRKGKKKMVLVRRGNRVKLVHFGQKGYEDYTQHKDKARRENYLKRSGGIRGKGGKLTANDPFSANYWARKELW